MTEIEGNNNQIKEQEKIQQFREEIAAIKERDLKNKGPAHLFEVNPAQLTEVDMMMWESFKHLIKKLKELIMKKKEEEGIIGEDADRQENLANQQDIMELLKTLVKKLSELAKTEQKIVSRKDVNYQDLDSYFQDLDRYQQEMVAYLGRLLDEEGNLREGISRSSYDFYAFIVNKITPLFCLCQIIRQKDFS